MPDFGPTSLANLNQIPQSGSNTAAEFRMQADYLKAPINIPVVLSSAAIKGATTLAITAHAVTGKVIPAGVLLHFPGGVGKPDITVLTTAPVVAADVVVNIEALGSDIATAAATAWEGYYYPALQAEVTLTTNGTTTKIDLHSASGRKAWSTALKSGMEYTISFKSEAPSDDPTIRMMTDVAESTGDNAVMNFRYRDGRGGWRYGNITTSTAGRTTPVRAQEEQTFTGMGLGEYYRRYAADNAS